MDRRLDPVTRDYLDDGAGGYLETPTIETMVLHQTLNQAGGDPTDPQGGSRVHELLAGAAGPGQVPAVRDAIAVALQPLVSAGLAADLRIDVEIANGRILAETHLRDVAGTEPEDLAIVLPLE